MKSPTSHAGKQENVEPTDSLEGLLVLLYHGPSPEYKEEFHTVENKKNHPIEAPEQNVIQLPMGEHTKREAL